MILNESLGGPKYPQGLNDSKADLTAPDKTLMERKYASLRVWELQEIFESAKSDREELLTVSHELDIRKTASAKRLADRVQEAISRLDAKPTPPPPKSAAQPEAKATVTAPPVQPIEDKTPTDWDPKQRVVIEGAGDDFRVVEAGPGSGKTAVACKRVAYLVEEHFLEPSKILLVSFTRTAVRELQNRIQSHAIEPGSVAGVRIVTLDSFTWQIIMGLGEEEPDTQHSSYEENIRGFTKMLQDEDKGVLDFLSELEHVIIDEAQDLVGDRADLVIELIKALPEECGVTVFGDSAQAIYGFTRDTDDPLSHPSTTAIDRIRGAEISDFAEINLENNHRTNDPKLLELCSTGREKLLKLKDGSIESWREMRDLIINKAHGEATVEGRAELKGRTDALVLHRTRTGAIQESSFLWSAGIDHKMRMSGIPPRIHPWIARVIGEHEEDILTESEFMGLWGERIDSDQDGAEGAWKLLKRYGWNTKDSIRMAKLRSVLGRPRPPLDCLVDEKDLPGPVVGTIHASKGREASEVRLMLPYNNYVVRYGETNQLSPEALAEEERVLFVGATRARQRLLTGASMSSAGRHLESGRVYRTPKGGKKSNRRQVEFGLVDDVSVPGMASKKFETENIKLTQEWLWNRRSSVIELKSYYYFQLEASILQEANEEMTVGMLGPAATRDLFQIARALECKRPAQEIQSLRMVGVTTAVIKETDRETVHSPWKRSGLVLMPVLTGFPIVYFNQ